MKQGERKAIALCDDAAVLFEGSNDPNVPVPRLTILNSQFAEDGTVFPPTSATVFGQSVRDLYDMLHEYYANAPHEWPAVAGTLDGVVGNSGGDE